jgi:hypothetical protein
LAGARATSQDVQISPSMVCHLSVQFRFTWTVGL